LFLFARIKGIPEEKIPTFVDNLIQQIGLREYADKPSGGYSGGNKRKLSVGMALIGNPSIVFLDEPSTGIDPSSRRFMWNLIASTMAGRSVILTTHSMEEAEALCNRIGIMVNGALACLGSATHLRSRFGQGYQIDINLGADKNNDRNGSQRLIEWIAQHFNEHELLEQQGTHFKFKVNKSLSLGKVFKEIENNKEALNIKEYSVSETSLEQIFLYFARRQQSEGGDENQPQFLQHNFDFNNNNTNNNTNDNNNVNKFNNPSNYVKLTDN